MDFEVVVVVNLYTDRQGTKVKFAGAGNEDEHGQSQ